MKRGNASCSGEGRQNISMQGEYVKVRKRALERLTTEVMQLHDILPQVLNDDVVESFQKLDTVEAIVEKREHELEQLRMDCEHFKARLEAAQADCMKERKEKLSVRQQLSEAKQQLLQQAEYCTEMGAAVCTLLWSVSSNEEAVKHILGSSKAVKFFSIAGQTMESFVRSLGEDIKQQDVDSDESQFVLALAGIVTNVAALACGREFLVNSNRVLLDTMMQLLGEMKPGCCSKLKVLMLMSLYNVSINVKGLKYISESPGFFPLLWWLLNENGSSESMPLMKHVTVCFISCFCWWLNSSDIKQHYAVCLGNVSEFKRQNGTEERIEAEHCVCKLQQKKQNKDVDPEVCLHVLRLLQSVILEPEVLTKSAPEMRDTLPFPRIVMLSKSRNVDLQMLAQDLLEDLKILESEI
ncbi:heat shock factor 2-binding protein isoform X2 [Hemicordylus capensis]|uniref:heat shock factor 2-binding protein isoform X2 n=1 Tax=Hemicordylus capensis TaxID=884348 RepID=UPI0023031D1F|nr:heat shock factor 2-binding protein isoform X2 [Hemicordylus capensis]